MEHYVPPRGAEDLRVGVPNEERGVIPIWMLQIVDYVSDLYAQHASLSIPPCLPFLRSSAETVFGGDTRLSVIGSVVRTDDHLDSGAQDPRKCRITIITGVSNTMVTGVINR
jgi:hypothetical protein